MLTPAQIEKANNASCPVCTHRVKSILGILGRLLWLRCQGCGIDYSVKLGDKMQAWIKIDLDSEPFIDNVQNETSRILAKLSEQVLYAQFFSGGVDIPLFNAEHKEVGFCAVYDEPKILTGGT